jgi:hypothetical protein
MMKMIQMKHQLLLVSDENKHDLSKILLKFVIFLFPRFF